MFKSKLLLSLIFVGFISLKLSAQKMESLPDSTVEFSVKSLKGIQLKIEAPFFVGLMPFRNGIPYFLNYIDEKRIAPSSTIIFKAGIIFGPGFFYDDTTTIFNPYVSHEIRGEKVAYCSFGFNFGIEPRWYWNNRRRDQLGKARLNSGWFLSLPLELTLPKVALLHGPTIYNYRKRNWIVNYFDLYYNLGISTGYRHALSNKWFLEGSVEIQVAGDWYKHYNYSSSSPLQIVPQIEIRASYVFSK